MANTQLSRTIGTATNGKKYTLSFWIKRSALGVEQSIVGVDSANLIELIKFGSNDQLYWYNRDNSGNSAENYTTRVFRDTNAWYNFIFAYDSTQGSASAQKRLWVNGVEETWGSANAIQSDAIAGTNFDTKTFYFGREGGGTSYFLNALMSHINYIDGTCYTASTFGSFDNDTGEWKINTSPSVSYGSNGFFILKDGNSVTDQSGNSNNFTVAGGTLTNTEDCPSNNFATLNVLQPSSSVLTITNGNTHIYSQSPNSWTTTPTTLAIPPTSKIYWEIKCIGVWGSSFCQLHGIVNLDNISQEANNVQASDSSDCYGWKNDGSFKNNGSTVSNTSWASSYTTNDILMFALDNSNGALYVGKNGSWLNSGDPTSGSSKTGALPVTAGLTYAPHSETKYGSDKPAYNFGNGVFVSTAITTNSGNGYAGAEGKSKFNYQPPTGYSALTTLGMNE